MTKKLLLPLLGVLLLLLSCQEKSIRADLSNQSGSIGDKQIISQPPSSLDEGEFFSDEISFAQSPHKKDLRLYNFKKNISKDRPINGRLRAVPAQWKYEAKIQNVTSMATLNYTNDRRKYEIPSVTVKWYDQSRILREVHHYLINNHHDAYYMKHFLRVKKYIYNKKGILEKIVGLNEGNNIMSRTEIVYFYDSKGRISQLDYNFKDGTRYQYKKYLYNEDDSYQIDQYEPIKYLSREFIKTWYETYDRFGNMTGRFQVNKKGVIVWKSTAEYNSKGMYIKGTDYDAMFNITQEYHAIYNDKGQKIKLEFRKHKGDLGPYNIYAYDNKGRIIKNTLYHNNTDGDRLMLFSTWEYE